MICPACGHPTPDAAKFCRGCGAPITPAAEETSDASWRCAGCERINRQGARFCAGCGAGSPEQAPGVGVATPLGEPSVSAAAAAVSTDLKAQTVDTTVPNCVHCGAAQTSASRFCRSCGQVAGEASKPASQPDISAAAQDATARNQAAEVEAPMANPTQGAAHSVGPKAPNGQPEHSSFNSRNTLLLAAGVVVTVALVGTVSAWLLLRHPSAEGVSGNTDNHVAPTTASNTGKDAAGATPPSANSLVAARSQALTVTPASSQTPPSVEASAPLEQQSAAAGNVSTHGADESVNKSQITATDAGGSSIAASKKPDVASAPVVSIPNPHPRVSQAATSSPANNAGDTTVQQLALKLVRQGEQDFGQQNYTSAIANAKAALQLSPANHRASELLQEAQTAQQGAMKQISIQ